MQHFLQTLPRQTLVLRGTCDPLSTPTPLGPLLDIAHVVGEPLAQLLAEEAPRQRVFGALRTLLSSSKPPTVLVFEDMHWADEATLDLLIYFGRRIATLPTLLIATYRDDELSAIHPLRIALGDLATSPAARRLSLPPLSEGAVRQLASTSHLDPHELYLQTAGNPFFVTEVLASGDQSVPPTVRDAVLARASRLSAEGRAALEVAAIFGASVELELLVHAEEVSEDGIDACLICAEPISVSMI